MVKNVDNNKARVSVCVLLYGNYIHLASRCLFSILDCFPRKLCNLVVGGNAVGSDTKNFLQSLVKSGHIDHLVLESNNINKCPMMRKLFEFVNTDFIWWFDDDSYVIQSSAWENWFDCVTESEENTVMWGQHAWCDWPEEICASEGRDLLRFVRTASWYRGFPPPSWRPGGKGEFNYLGRGIGNGRWHFITGGSWLIRTKIIRALNWPDHRLLIRGDDIMLGEALRQNQLRFQHIPNPRMIINDQPTRGERGKKLTTNPY